MNFLYLLLFVVLQPAFAVSLSKYKSTPEHNLLQEFKLKNGKGVFEKRTNFFDSKLDYRLGVLTSNEDKLKEIEKKLAEIKTKITKVDTFLKQKDSSFNALTSKGPHETFWLVDDYQISSKSTFHEELEDIFEELQGVQWNLKDGLQVSENLTQLSKASNGKLTPTKLKAEDCKKAQTQSVCHFSKIGILYAR